MAFRSYIRSPRRTSVTVLLIMVILFQSTLTRSQDENSSKSESAENAPGSDTSVDESDLDPKGNCSEDINVFCTPKKGSYLDCIILQLQNEQAGVTHPSGREVAADCKLEIRTLKINSYKDLTLNKKIETACGKDIQKTCSEFLGEGGVLGCLRANKEALSENCQNEVFKAEADAANDFQMDPLLYEKCSKDARAYCTDVSPTGGRIQACLRARTTKLTYPCKAELFRQEQENAGDFRLNVELYKACENDKQKFCANVRPGNARIKDCLENSRLDPEFSQTCKDEVDKMLARRSEDFRLDPILRESCQSDIHEVCGSELEYLTDLPEEVPRVLHCLQDYKDELKDPMCQKEVHKVLVRAAQDYRLDAWFAKSCEESKQKFCKDVDNSKVLQCLQKSRKNVDDNCRSALFDMEWRLSGDIDYKIAMKNACGLEIGKFCQGLRRDRGDTIECLQQRVDDPEMREECRKEVIADEVESAKDYRLNYRIYNDCYEDVTNLQTSQVCQVCKRSEPCEGIVLECLQTNMDQIKSEECLKDVFSFTVKESRNLELNAPLQQACQPDIQKYCPKLETKDHTNTLRCLRSHRSKLAKECKDEELRFSVMEASDIRLTPSLMNACGAELSQFCKSVSPANGEAFKCLQMHLEDVEMGTPCKIEVDLQEARQASDYRLDVRVRKECQEDVNTLCSDVDPIEEGHAPVLKCFVSKFHKLSGGCQTEVAYAARMALWQYRLGSNLTADCDDDVQKSCDKDVKPIENVVIGSYGQCLTSQNLKKLNSGCRALVQAATKEGSYVGGRPEVDLAAAIAKLKEYKANGGDLTQSSMTFFWMTTAVAFIALLAVVLLRKYSGPPRAYTVVVKGGDV
ncbi:hypothetical protein R1sor_002844 [Riccia sorocarpa]|uniref:Golgi apparatus protein 1 n=1 Tax=Riccia sorocarpa TaxID=122646 RepID=A0ABD3H2L0_9MARC